MPRARRVEVGFELLVIGFAGLVALAVLSAIGGLAAFILWLVVLPFRLLAFVFKGLVALLFIPLFLVIGLVVAAAVGLPVLLFVLLPVMPLVLLMAGIVWLAKKGVGRAAATR